MYIIELIENTCPERCKAKKVTVPTNHNKLDTYADTSLVPNPKSTGQQQ